MVQFWEYFVLDPDTGEEQQRLMEARMPINKVGVWCRALNQPSRGFTVLGDLLKVPTSTFTKNLLRHYAKRMVEHGM